MKKYPIIVAVALCFVSVLFGAGKHEVNERSAAKAHEGPRRIYSPMITLHDRTIMINEGFEGTFPPVGWDLLTLPGGIQGGTTPIPWHRDNIYSHSGTYGAAYGWGYNLNGWMRILNLDFSQVASATLSWWWESSYYWHVSPYDNGDLFIKVSTNSGATWDTLWTFGDQTMVVNSGVPWPWSNFVWYQSTISLDAYAYQPNVWVGFHVVANDNADIGVDDVVIDTVGGTVTVVWDFEDGWQGWTHTNGIAFPGGWEPYDATWRAPSYQCPTSGDSSMCVDFDMYLLTISDTALSPILVPNQNTHWLKYGFLYNDIGSYPSDFFEVGIKYFNGATWTAVPLITYNDDQYGNWDSLDVSAYNTHDLIQIYFYYYALGSGWYAAFDNVSIIASIAEHDVGCTAITSPPAGAMVATGNYDVIGRIRNVGDFIETFDVVAEVWDTTTGTQVFTQTLTLTNFAPTAESLVNFGTVTFEQSKVYRTLIYTMLSSDENPDNDTTAIYSTTIMFNKIWNFETGLQGWTHTNGLAFPAGWAVRSSGYKPTWTPPSAGDSTMWIDSDAAGTSVTIWDTAYSPAVVPSTSTNKLKYAISFYWYSGGNSEYVTVGIRAFTGGAWQTPVELRRYQNTDFGPAWDSVDISAYQTADSIKVLFSYNNAYYEWWVGFDNVMLNVMTGIAEEPVTKYIPTFGFAPTVSTIAKGLMPISYTTTAPGHVSLKVYDGMGRLVQTLINSRQPAGEKSLIWNGKDVNNRAVAAGVYFLCLEAENETALRKFVLVR